MMLSNRFRYCYKFIVAWLLLSTYLFRGLKFGLSENERWYEIILNDRKINIYLFPHYIIDSVRFPFFRMLRVTFFSPGVPSAWAGLKCKEESWQHLGGGWGNDSVDIAAKWLTRKVALPYE